MAWEPKNFKGEGRRGEGRRERREEKGKGKRREQVHIRSPASTISKWKLGEQNQQSLGNESLFTERAGHLCRERFVLERSLGDGADGGLSIFTLMVV